MSDHAAIVVNAVFVYGGALGGWFSIAAIFYFAFTSGDD